jgi:hypothetical protein
MKEICDLNGETHMDPYRCKSAACAMGWTPAVFPRLLKWVPVSRFNTYDSILSVMAIVPLKNTKAERLCNLDAMQVVFDISHLHAACVFGSGRKTYHTPKQVARGIREYIALEGVRLPERMV